MVMQVFFYLKRFLIPPAFPAFLSSHRDVSSRTSKSPLAAGEPVFAKRHKKQRQQTQLKQLRNCKRTSQKERFAKYE